MLAVVVMLAADIRALTTLPLRLNPAPFSVLALVILPDALTDPALTEPAEIKLPPVTLAVTETTPPT